MRSRLQALQSVVSQIWDFSADPEELRLKKSVLLIGSALVILATLVWGSIFLIYGETRASSISFLYSIITTAGLILTRRTGNFELYLKAQLVLGLALPFAHHLVLGGFWQSSGVLIWSLISPMGAMLFLPFRETRYWWLAFLGLLVLASGFNASIEHANRLPSALITVFFGLNFGGVSTIVVLMFSYFISQREEAYRLLGLEEAKTQSLLRNVLPDKIADILKDEQRVIADSFSEASILFADLVNFTRLTTELEPTGLVNLLNEIFSFFDTKVDHYKVEKIRTIGDNHMVVAGVPDPVEDHAGRLARLALDMQAYLAVRQQETGVLVSFRIGINSGAVIGGVIGQKKFVYDVWGDAVNIASRMQSTCDPGRIQVSRTTYDLIKDAFHLQPRGQIELKGRGMFDTWYLVGETPPHGVHPNSGAKIEGYV